MLMMSMEVITNIMMIRVRDEDELHMLMCVMYVSFAVVVLALLGCQRHIFSMAFQGM